MIALLALAACDAGDPPAPPGCVPGDHLWVGTSDGSVSALAAVADGELSDRIASAYADLVLDVVDGTPVALGRTQADALRTYDPGCYGAPIAEIPLPEGSNPHDVASAAGRWFVSAWGGDGLLVLDPGSGALTGAVDLTPWADPESGTPDADAIVVGEGALWVGLQALHFEGSTAVGDDGSVAVVDPVTLGVVADWPTGPNPRLFAHPYEPARPVVLTGLYTFGRDPVTDGVVELLDPSTGALEVVAREVPASEEDVPAGRFAFDLSDYAEADGHGVVVGVDFAENSASRVMCVDWATGRWTVGPALDSFLIDLVAGGGVVWVAANSGRVEGAASGVFAIDPASCAATADPWIHPALGPVSLAWVEAP